ncbi:gamma-glutamylcyclotransferase [Paraburkholderia sp. BCC1885]|uniref:gamma-glutamylcyclotransferase n=1 Tax=Paraburkholderia sp. BCC1885 TaxID=2562669 RepID=UPI00118446A8|nr:gamma-glutamylcyclotransferase [Paraburkholderia sp. BCC1885]
MLKRHFLQSDEFKAVLASLPEHIRWSPERIGSSMRETLSKRPVDSDVWLFCYGSLIWNPVVHFIERESATLPGWSRSFTLGLRSGRASAAHPGRMLGLEPGGETQGVVIRFDEDSLDDELPLVWAREMISGAYRPVWQPVILRGGRRVTSLVFVADRAHPYWCKDASVKTIVPILASASGPLGTNAEYVLRLADALTDLRVRDEYIDALASALREHGGSGGRIVP